VRSASSTRPAPSRKGCANLVRCRDDLRRARTAARHRAGKQLLRYRRLYREGKKSRTLQHRAWLRRQCLDDPLAQAALEHMRCHLDAIDAQIAAVDHQLDEIARPQPRCDPLRWLSCFRGIATLTALALLAQIGDFHRSGSPRELMSFLGLSVSEYSPGERRQRGQTTKTGNRHARRLLVEAAWH
jgi:transposase